MAFSIHRRGRRPYPGLTPAEERVLPLVREGLTNAEIAERLSITHHTVKYHVANLLAKLDASNRHALASDRLDPEPRPPGPGTAPAILTALKLVLASLAVSVVAVCGLAAFQWARGEPPSDRPSEVPPDGRQFAGRAIHFATDSYINYADRGGPNSLPPVVIDRQTRQHTEIWMELDNDLRVIRYRAITTLPDGSLDQDRRYEAGIESENDYAPSDTPAPCFGAMEIDDSDSGLFVMPGTFLALGYVPTTAGSSTAAAPGAEAFARFTDYRRPGFVTDREVALLDPSTGQDLGRVIQGVRPDGSLVLLESSISTKADTLPSFGGWPGEFATLPLCGHGSSGQ